jgi:predicted RNase H-like HicB family nuclease
MATIAKQKNCAEKNDPIDRPFAKTILRQARQIANNYQIVLSHEADGWYGRGLELPLSMGDGRDPAECVKNTWEALVVTVAYLLEKGEQPPQPADDQERTEQINIRLTRREKLLLEQTATRLGHRGVSDYLRASALGRALRG